MQSFSAGSNVGVGAFTKMIIKDFVKKRQIIAFKKDFEEEKKNIFKQLQKKRQNINLLDVSDKHKKDMFKLFNTQNKDLQKELDDKEKAFAQLTEQTSASYIITEAASTALIYTLASMTGEILKFGIGIALQLMMPNIK